jgi:hypothetical protein
MADALPAPHGFAQSNSCSHVDSDKAVARKHLFAFDCYKTSPMRLASSSQRSLLAPVRLLDPVSLAVILVIGYAAFLIGAFVAGAWPVDQNGHPTPVDYLSMWAAGRLALAGHPADAYNWATHKAVEVAAVGYDFRGYFSWFYPPTFFFATVPFAALPFVPALLAWIAVGLLLLLAGIHSVIPGRGAMTLAAAAPVVLLNAMAGQNGYLSAAIFAGGLALLERRPLVAGALFACLSFKPQFGLLVPVALACGGHWRAFLAAAVASVLLVVTSAAIFGGDAWTGFIASIGVANQTILVDTSIGAGKLQSLFGLSRLLDLDTRAAWEAQCAVAIPVAIFVAWLWRSPAPIDLKAAALVAGTALITPYVLIYDLVILIVPIAFLARTRLSRSEAGATTAAGLIVLSRLVTDAPVGLAASLIVFAIVVIRTMRWRRDSRRPAKLAAASSQS